MTRTLGDFSEPLFKLDQHRICAEELRHLRIEIHQRDLLDRRILQNLAHRQAVAAAEHQHATRSRQRRQSGMHERLVIAILVARAELQVRAEEQPQVVLPLRQHDSLVSRVAREDDFVGVEVVIG